MLLAEVAWVELHVPNHRDTEQTAKQLSQYLHKNLFDAAVFFTNVCSDRDSRIEVPATYWRLDDHEHQQHEAHCESAKQGMILQIKSNCEDCCP